MVSLVLGINVVNKKALGMNLRKLSVSCPNAHPVEREEDDDKGQQHDHRGRRRILGAICEESPIAAAAATVKSQETPTPRKNTKTAKDKENRETVL
jgi:hypothetical protein